MQTPKTIGRGVALFVKPLPVLLVLLGFQLIQAGSLVRGPESPTSAHPISTTTHDAPATTSSPELRFTDLARARAVTRGLKYIYRTSLNRRNFAEYSGDYLWCFYTLAVAAHDEQLKQMARHMGVERALFWRRLHPTLPRNAEATTIQDYVFASDAADNLDVRDDRLKESIRRAAARYAARDYLLFDPLTEPPPADVPEECEYDGAINPRGSKRCHVCKRLLEMRSRYDVWCDALITTYSGEHYGVVLGARYADVLKWLPVMRPYRGNDHGANPDFFYTVYAVTHVIYTLNDYTQYRLSPDLLPQEYKFLKSNLREAITARDPDMLGEFMDTLMAFGLTSEDPDMRAGSAYLLSHQHRDGSWGDKDIRNRYHVTWTAIDGLADYEWRAGEGLTLTEVKSLLKG
jgi:hypothetical protein